MKFHTSLLSILLFCSSNHTSQNQHNIPSSASIEQIALIGILRIQATGDLLLKTEKYQPYKRPIQEVIKLKLSESLQDKIKKLLKPLNYNLYHKIINQTFEQKIGMQELNITEKELIHLEKELIPALTLFALYFSSINVLEDPDVVSPEVTKSNLLEEIHSDLLKLKLAASGLKA